LRKGAKQHSREKNRRLNVAGGAKKPKEEKKKKVFTGAVSLRSCWGENPPKGEKRRGGDKIKFLVPSRTEGKKRKMGTKIGQVSSKNEKKRRKKKMKRRGRPRSSECT